MLNLMIFWLLGSSIAVAAIDEKLHVIQKECSFTRYPSLCVQTLMEFKNNHLHIVSALVNKTILETQLHNSYFKSLITAQFEIQEAQHLQSITDYCDELMKMSLKLLDKSLMALNHQSRRINKNDIQTWLSAVVTYQQACKESVNTSGQPAGDFASQISRKMDYLSELVSNPLSLVNRISDGDENKKIKYNTKYRHLNEELEDFPKWVSAKDRKLLQSSTIKANAVVAKDGTGNYRTVSEAIKAASGGRFVIYVKAGVYTEKIRSGKDGITLIGEGKYSTVIVGGDSVRGGSSMPDSATFTITGNGFIAKDIGFQNTAGPQGGQALALYIASDRSVLYKCSISGHQDTLYALSQRQFYRECDISGTVDFIFGNAAAVFQNCNLLLHRPYNNGAYNVILANGRTDPGQNTGFSVQNCRITASFDFSPVKRSYNSYLGRPWKQYSRSVIMESYIDDAVSSSGWIAWPGATSYDKTLYFAEYANTGPGGGTSGRVNWEGHHVIGADVAVEFTVGRFISGTSWLPSTGVTFVSGL
ncbi:pectinesterase [Mercurialis annua]|uniref:pectinesterase n=1 Tax=Mercurialis annua TaxID=3986 RepID=UPI00215E0B69|nr:pectinesterase [Mercurialis annua]